MAPDAPARYELCAVCDEPTGRAGAGDDSLYAADVGPLCQGCYDGAFSARSSAPDAALPEAVSIGERLTILRVHAEAQGRAGAQFNEGGYAASRVAADAQVDAILDAIAAAIADARREAGARGRADMAAELDAAIAQAHAAHAAGYVDDADHDDDWTPPVCLSFQPWAGGTWRVALDDGRADPPDMARETPTEALVMLAHRLAATAAPDAGEGVGDGG